MTPFWLHFYMYVNTLYSLYANAGGGIGEKGDKDSYCNQNTPTICRMYAHRLTSRMRNSVRCIVMCIVLNGIRSTTVRCK